MKRIRTIPLGNSTHPALVDEDDYKLASGYGWCINGVGYVVAHVDGRVVYLSHFLLDVPDDMVVVHLNGDKFDFRRANLRIGTRSEAMQRQKKRSGTTSKYKGVQLHKKSGRWRSTLWRRDWGRNQHLGYFESEAEAAKAYDEAARTFYGEDAWVNFE